MKKKLPALMVILPVGILFFLLSFLSWVKPADSFSNAERRALASMPDFSAETVLSGDFMEDFDRYATDQFPFREPFRTLKALWTFYGMRMSDNNDVVYLDGHLSKLDPVLNPAMIEYAVSLFTSVQEWLLSEGEPNLYFCIIPDKNYFLSADGGIPAMDYDAMFSYFETALTGMTHIDITGLLSLEDYYTTDSHWRQECILRVASALAGEMGTTLSASYREVAYELPFYGVYFGQSALPVPPDTLLYLTNETLENCTVSGYDVNSSVAMYDLERAGKRDAYELFLSGTQPIVVIENPNAGTDRELILFRDSFGSSIAPLLAEQYRTVTLVDLRYINSNLLGEYLTVTDQDVLFLYSSTILNSSSSMR